MNLCKNCRHMSLMKALCLNEKSVRPDYIHGDHGHYSCSAQRSDLAACGPAGAWFEPRTVAEAAE